MKVLFTTGSGLGHLHPLVPVARALEIAGHEVRFACSEAFRGVVQAAGFSAHAVGDPSGFKALPEMLVEMNALSGLDARMAFGRRRMFADIRPKANARDVLALMAEWNPSLLVRDATDFASWAAAEKLGVPHASVEVGAFWSAERWREEAGEELAELLEIVGLPRDHDLESLYRYLHLIPFPPACWRDDERQEANVRPFRFELYDGTHKEDEPGWIAQLPRPAIYATLGSTILRQAAVFAQILEAFESEPYGLVLTLGADGDPSAYGPQLPHRRIERYLPQTQVLPSVDLVVSQGGQGTVLGALSFGVPQVVLPLGADQLEQARRVVRCGVGLALTEEERSPASIRDAARRVLKTSAFRERALELQNEIQSLPLIGAAVPLLEEISAS